jgi:ABC-type dipeptide/oligopeptide/nickel transport system permease subunit
MTEAPSHAAALNQTETPKLLASRPKMSASQGLGLAFWLPAAWIVVLLFMTVFADILPLHDPAASDFANLKSRPNLEYWFGTDVMARDILSRVIHGARISLAVAFFAPMFGMMIGLALGMLAGYYRGTVESMIVGITDVILAFPNIVLAMSILFFAGANVINLDGGTSTGCPNSPNSLARNPAEYRAAAAGLHIVVYGDYHHDRGIAFVSGCGRSTANADMGRDDRHGFFRHQYRPSYYFSAGVGFISYRAVAQLDR